MTSRRGQAVRSVTTRVVQILLSAVTGVVVARSLHPEGRGAYAVIVTIAATAVTIGELSVTQAHASLWAQARAAIATNSLILGPVVGLISAAVTVVVVATVGADLVPATDRGVLLLALGAVPFGVTSLYLTNVVLLQGRVGVQNRSALLSAVVSTTTLVALAATHRLTVAWVVVMWAVALALPLVNLVPAMRRPLARWDPGVLRQALSRGLRYHLGFVALTLLYRVDVFLLKALSTVAAVGLYSLAVTVAELTRIATTATTQVTLAEQASADLGRSAEVTVRTVRMSVLLSTIAVGGVCAVSPIAVPLAYGDAFAGSVPPLLALAPGLFVLGSVRPIGAYLLRLNRPGLVTAAMVGAMGLNVGLNLLMIPVWGPVGCAVASSVAYTALAGTQIGWFLRTTGMSPRQLIPGAAEVRSLTRLILVRRRT